MNTGQFLYSSKGKIFKIFGPHDTDGLNMLKEKIKIFFITADKKGFKFSEKRNPTKYEIETDYSSNYRSVTANHKMTKCRNTLRAAATVAASNKGLIT